MLIWIVGLLAWANTVCSFFNSNETALPDYPFIIIKTVLFCALVGAILLLGKPSRGKSLKATQPDALLTLRAFAALMVILGHYFVTGLAKGFATPLPFVLLTSSPWAGVWLFFVLSGYLMGKGFYSGRYDLSEGGLSAFFRNRALRILPVYSVVIIGLTVIFVPFFFSWKTWWVWAEYFTFDFKGPLPARPHGAAWTISTEVQFYFLAPFLSYWIRPLSKKMALALIVIGPVIPIVILRLLKMDWLLYVYTPTLANLGLFCAGIATNNLVRDVRISEDRVIATTTFGLFAMLFFYLVMAVWTSYTVDSGIPNGYFKLAPILTAWVASLIIFSFERTQRKVHGALRTFLLRAEIFGALTYCIYLVHEPILQYFVALKPQPVTWHRIATFPIFLVIVVIAAYLLYRLVEKPADRLRSGHVKEKEVGGGVLPH